MGAVTKNGKYYIAHDVQDNDYTITVINIENNETLTASVVLNDTICPKKWVFTITSSMPVNRSFVIIIDHIDSIKTARPKIIFDNDDNLSVVFEVIYDYYTSELRINDDYKVNRITYAEFMSLFTKSCVGTITKIDIVPNAVE